MTTSGATVRSRSELEPALRAGGRYAIEDSIGQGGMGQVYRAVDESTRRTLALKRLVHRSRRERDRRAERLLFEREFHTLARLRHPRIVEAYDFGVDDVGAFYTMELLDGADLRDEQFETPRRACAVLRDVASALAFLHSRRLLHRDVAARNVRCTTDGRAKLIDFGALATVGVTGDVVGTPPYVPPEAMRRLPLDPLSDLYGLGALAYFLLTGKHAYPARLMTDLVALWTLSPPAPSSVSAWVPKALDDLVLSLLSHEPLARPSSAAEVIDRLGAIGELEPLADAGVTRGYLASAALVGRQKEMSAAKDRIEKLGEGRGAALVVQAPSGTGKSRLLREIGLEAQLAGATVARVDASQTADVPWGVVRAIGRELVASLREGAVDAARPYAPVIGRVIPELRDAIPGLIVAKPAGDPREDRAAIQTRLVAWLRDAARERSLVVIIDDVQRADEASASVLAALAHEARDRRLLLVAALRTDEAPRAAAAVATLRDAAVLVRLRGLSPDEIGELARALFGDVPNLSRLARWMHEVAGGSPLYTIELVQHAIDRGILRYADGLWLVPEEVTSAELPSGLKDAMDRRLAAISPDALALARVLSLVVRDVDLELAVSLAAFDDAARGFSALDELVEREVLIGAGGSHRFRHDGVREAARRTLGSEEEKSLHRRIGVALFERLEPGAEPDAEIGWHLLRGGDELRGARILEQSGRALFDAQSWTEGVPPLEAALEVYERHHRDVKTHLELRFLLVTAGFLCDRKLSEKYADDTLRELARYSGVRTAVRLGPWIGRLAALVVGVLGAVVAWAAGFGRTRPRPSVALRWYVVSVVYTSGVYAMSLDMKRLETLVRAIEPVAVMRSRPLLYGAWAITRASYDYPAGNVGNVLDLAAERLPLVRRTPGITEIERLMVEGAWRFSLSLIGVVHGGLPNTLDHIDAMEGLGVKVWEVCGVLLRMNHHVFRGEDEAAQELRAKSERLLLQLGGSWQIEAWVPVAFSFAYGLTRNVLGLKRIIEQLARLTREGLHYGGNLDLARGEYHRERGEIDEAIRCLESAARKDPPVIRQVALGALAEALLAKGELRRAKKVAEECIAISSTRAHGLQNAELRCSRALALIEAALGDLDAAERRIGTLVERAERIGNPAMCGSMHEAGAHVALLRGDRHGYEHHLEKVHEWFAPTQNPLFLSRYERLVAVGDRRSRASLPGEGSDLTEAAVTTIEPVAETAARARTTLALCRGPAERAERALRILVEASSAESGYLFAAKGEKLEIVAPAVGEEPPDAVLATVDELVRRSLDAGEPATVRELVTVAAGEREFFPVLLSLPWEKERPIVGAVVLVVGATRLREPDPEVLAAVAEGLHEAGDARSIHLSTRGLRSSVGP